MYRAPAGERVLGGVAAGVAHYLGVAPNIIRLAFIVLAFFGGLGVLVYVAGLLIMPERPPHLSAERGPAGMRLDSVPALIGAVLILLALTILLSDVWFWSGEVFWALILIIAGIVLFRRAENPGRPTAYRGTPPTSQAAAAPYNPGAVAPGYRGPGGTGGGDAPYPATSWEPTPSRRPRAVKEPSPLGRLTIAVTLVVTGAAIWLDQFTGVSLSGVQIGALALAVIGLGLLVGTFFGRARWLVALALVVALPLILAASLNLPFDVTTGQRFISPATAAEVAPRYNLGVGQLNLDLSDVELDGETIEVDASVGLGELLITVPDGVGVEVDAHVGAGKYELLGQVAEGTDLRRRIVSDPDGAAAGTVHLDARVGLGTMSIETSNTEQELR